MDVTTVGNVSTDGPAELVERAAARDEDAWRELVDRYTRLVWHVIRGAGLSGELAADVHQATWLKLAEHIDRINNPAAVGGWLATTARRECIRVSQRAAREVPSDLGADIGPVREPLDRHLLEEERDAELWAAFSDLPQNCQQLLRLLMAEPPFSYDEISVILDMPKGSIGPTRSRCLDRLRSDPRIGALEGQT